MVERGDWVMMEGRDEWGGVGVNSLPNPPTPFLHHNRSKEPILRREKS